MDGSIPMTASKLKKKRRDMGYLVDTSTGEIIKSNKNGGSGGLFGKLRRLKTRFRVARLKREGKREVQERIKDLKRKEKLAHVRSRTELALAKRSLYRAKHGKRLAKSVYKKGTFSRRLARRAMSKASWGGIVKFLENGNGGRNYKSYRKNGYRKFNKYSRGYYR